MKTIRLTDAEVRRLTTVLGKRIEWNKGFDPNIRLPFVQRDPELVKKMQEEKKKRDVIVKEYQGILAKLEK